MELHNLCQQFNSLIRLLDAHRHDFSASTDKLLISDTSEDTQSALNSAAITFEKVAEGYSIPVNRSSGSRFFFNEEAVLKVSTYSILADNDFAVISERVCYDAASSSFQNTDGKRTDCPVLENHLAYLKMKAVVCKTQSPSTIRVQEVETLMSYHDETEKKMVMISGTKGVMYIGYEQPSPRFEAEIALRSQVERLSNAIPAKGYISLLKQELHDVLRSEAVEKRLEAMARHLQRILDNADSSFEVYMSNFSIEALKDKFRQEKAKYYGAMREVLSKVYSQITATTVAASASAIAGAAVQQPAVYLFIGTAYIVYAAFVLVLLHALQREVTALEDEFDAEKAELMQKSKLSKELVEKEVGAITSRFKAARAIIVAFRWMFVVLTALFVGYITWRFIQSKIEEVRLREAMVQMLINIVDGLWQRRSG